MSANEQSNPSALPSREQVQHPTAADKQVTAQSAPDRPTRSHRREATRAASSRQPPSESISKKTTYKEVLLSQPRPQKGKRGPGRPLMKRVESGIVPSSDDSSEAEDMEPSSQEPRDESNANLVKGPEGKISAVSQASALNRLAEAIEAKAPKRTIQRLKRDFDRVFAGSPLKTRGPPPVPIAEGKSRSKRRRARPETPDSQSDASDLPIARERASASRSEKKKLKRKSKRRTHAPSSDDDRPAHHSESPDSRSGTESDSTVEESSSSSSDEGAVQFLRGDMTPSDLPELPHVFAAAFEGCKAYIPLSIFVIGFLREQRNNLSLLSTASRKSRALASASAMEEHTIQHGDALSAIDLLIRYAREMFRLKELADYMETHKQILGEIKTRHTCWTVALRYDIAICGVIFRWHQKRVPIMIPNGLVESVEKIALAETERAGDLGYVDNPYAIGRPKFGYDFHTGKPKAVTTNTNRNNRLTPDAESSLDRTRYCNRSFRHE